MKKFKSFALLSGMLIPFVSSAQIVVSSPETATTASVANSTFHNFIIAMTSDSSDLYTPEGLSLSVTSPIYFNYMPSSPGFVGDWSNSPAGGPATALEFVHVPNFPAFLVGAGGTIDVGFIGEESKHDNEFGFHEGATYTKLFDYNAGGQNPPMSYSLTATSDTSIKFQHRNQTVFTGAGFQANSERFRIYRVLENGELTNEYLFATADRDGTMDGDYDDGFFYVVGGIQPVPEPAQIASLAVLGLLGALYLRRRIKQRK